MLLPTFGEILRPLPKKMTPALNGPIFKIP